MHRSSCRAAALCSRAHAEPRAELPAPLAPGCCPGLGPRAPKVACWRPKRLPRPRPRAPKVACWRPSAYLVQGLAPQVAVAIAGGALEVVGADALAPEGLLHPGQVVAHAPVNGAEHGLQVIHTAPDLRQAGRVVVVGSLERAGLHAMRFWVQWCSPASEWSRSILEHPQCLLYSACHCPAPMPSGSLSDARPPRRLNCADVPSHGSLDAATACAAYCDCQQVLCAVATAARTSSCVPRNKTRCCGAGCGSCSTMNCKLQPLLLGTWCQRRATVTGDRRAAAKQPRRQVWPCFAILTLPPPPGLRWQHCCQGCCQHQCHQPATRDPAARAAHPRWPWRAARPAAPPTPARRPPQRTAC